MAAAKEAAMRIRAVEHSSRALFIDYAAAHGAEHDDSYASVEELATFDPDSEPACVALGETDDVVGAGSLMVAGYSGEGLARFRILHALHPGVYGAMVEHLLGRLPAAAPGTLGGVGPASHSGVAHVFLFLPEHAAAEVALRKLGFVETRRAALLRRPDRYAAEVDLPLGIEIREARVECDAAAWAAVTNAAFAGGPGRYDVTPGWVGAQLSHPRVLPGGALIAWRDTEPVGVALAAREMSGDGCSVGAIDTLAVVPREQGGGIGGALLAAAVAVARAAGFAEIELSTGAANDRALSLYRSRGFEVVDLRVCFGRDVGSGIIKGPGQTPDGPSAPRREGG